MKEITDFLRAKGLSKDDIEKVEDLINDYVDDQMWHATIGEI